MSKSGVYRLLPTIVCVGIHFRYIFTPVTLTLRSTKGEAIDINSLIRVVSFSYIDQFRERPVARWLMKFGMANVYL